MACFAMSANESKTASGALAGASNDQLFDMLDKMVKNRDAFIDQKRATIDNIKSRLRGALNNEERFGRYSHLFEEYLYFNPDSALHYADLAEAIAPGNMGDKDEWIMHRGEVYAIAGLFTQAEGEFSKINPATLSKSLKPNYYDALNYYYKHNSMYSAQDPESAAAMEAKASAYKDSVALYITPDYPQYRWWKAVLADGGTMSDEDYNKLKQNVESSMLDSRNDAMAAYWLARASKNRGDNDSYIRYLIYSAMADVRIANCDIASLEILSAYLFDKGDIDRAYAYADYCSYMAILYHNRLRMVTFYGLKGQIHSRYLDTIEDQKNSLSKFLVGACVLLLLLLSAIVAAFISHRHSKKYSRRLAETNQELHEKMEELALIHSHLQESHNKEQELNASLAKANQEIQQASDLKQQAIINAFVMASDFISNVETLNKKLLRKVKTNQYGELRNELESPQFLSNELKQFYKAFDKMFLSIYPDFIKDFNATHPENERVEIKEGELPNTRMRIYALHKLGITESGKIAKMLRCSIQTVYNNRPRNI